MYSRPVFLIELELSIKFRCNFFMHAKNKGDTRNIMRNTKIGLFLGTQISFQMVNSVVGHCLI